MTYTLDISITTCSCETIPLLIYLIWQS